MAKRDPYVTVRTEAIERLAAVHTNPKTGAVDNTAVVREAIQWVATNHPNVVQARSQKFLWDDFSQAIRRRSQATRPTMKDILVKIAGIAHGQQVMNLPEYREIERETYIIGGQTYLLVNMTRALTVAAITEYGQNERENGQKRRRLEAVLREMDRRHLSDTDTVQRLYGKP